MDGYHGFFWAVFNVFALLHLVHAQNTEGFISLDCGLPAKESPYTDRETALVFTSDAKFVSSGKSGSVAKDYIGDYKPHHVLRYFPDGIRNCYTIKVKESTNYLVRAEFVYGNYDGLNVAPRFDLYIGPNLWTSVADNEDKPEKEIIHMTTSKSLQICLVKTGTTTPFISSLELRPLASDSYRTQSGSLKLNYRWSMISSDHTIRFPVDVYDRKWSYKGHNTSIRKVETNLTVDSSNPYEIPQPIIRLGYTPINASEPLTVQYFGENLSDQFYLYLHFAEIETLRENDVREFVITWNGNVIDSAYSPEMLQLETLSNASTKRCEGVVCELQLVRTPRSTLPPLVNAYEAFSVVELLNTETYPDDVFALKLIQATHRLNTINWQGDPCVPRSLKWDYVECSYNNMSTPPRVIYLNLSERGLKGMIDPAIQILDQLQKLDLSGNSLSGEIPEFLANMESLSTLNLGWNKLEGQVPQALLDRIKHGLNLNLERNPKLCVGDQCKNSNTKLLVSIVASVVALILAVGMMFLWFSKKKKSTSRVRQRSPITKSTILTKKRRFTYSEVEVMSNNFERVIGEGGFGTVYHGVLSDNEQVAVKKLSHSSTQGYKQFKAEVELLLRVHHTNLVSLVGYCNEEDHLALVYEYAANGDLKQYLSEETNGGSLSWTSRLKIAIETAQGLEYLHIGCEPPMIHRDVKTTNILLDEKFQAKLADFGLSRSSPVGDESHVSTNVVGTPGYLDPEYFRTNWLTEKSDVYSLGIVLLEMITNRPVIQQDREMPHIGEWVGLMLTKGDIESIMDPNMNGDYDSSSVWKALELAMSCVNPSSSERPNMSQVVSELKECLIYECSKKEGKSDMDSKSSLELSTSFTAEETPDAR